MVGDKRLFDGVYFDHVESYSCIRDYDHSDVRELKKELKASGYLVRVITDTYKRKHVYKSVPDGMHECNTCHDKVCSLDSVMCDACEIFQILQSRLVVVNTDLHKIEYRIAQRIGTGDIWSVKITGVSSLAIAKRELKKLYDGNSDNWRIVKITTESYRVRK